MANQNLDIIINVLSYAMQAAAAATQRSSLRGSEANARYGIKTESQSRTHHENAVEETVQGL